MAVANQDPAGRSWGRYAAIAVAIAFVLLLAFGLVGGADSSIDDALSKGRSADAPAFELEVLDMPELPQRLERKLAAASADGRISRDELVGVPYVLNFWASWCGPCRDEAADLQAGWERDGPKGILYLGLNMQDLSDDARAFIDEFTITYPTIRDPGKDTAFSYGAIAIPETYFIDRRGKVVGHAIGVVGADLLQRGAEAARKGELVGRVGAGDSRPSR